MNLEEYEAQINTHFSSVQARRGELPIFGLEHGLNGDQLLEMTSLLGRSLRANEGEAIFKRYPLCVVAYSSEIGYEYLGTGTDFWPRFELRLASQISGEDRHAHTAAFWYAHERYGLKRPADTPWTRNFGNIAWPIANAVASKEIHRSLARSLRRVMTFAFSNSTVGDLVDRLLIEARSQQNTRLIEWLQDTGVAEALIARLLEIPIQDAAVDAISLDRVVADLATDPIAQQSIISAAQVRKEKSVELQQQPFRLRLHLDDTGIARVGLKVPPLSDIVRSALENEMSRCGGGITLLDGGCELKPYHLVPGLEVNLKVQAYLSMLLKESAFLDGFNTSEGSSVEFLEFEPEVEDPMVFVEEANSDHFAQWHAGIDISRSDRVLLVSTKAASDDAGLTLVASNQGFFVYKADLSSEKGRLKLSESGVFVKEDPSFGLIGGVPVSYALKGPVFARGMPVLLKANSAVGSGEWSVKSDKAGKLQLAEDELIVSIDDGQDLQELEITTAAGKAKLVIGFLSNENIGKPLFVGLDPSSPSVEDVLRGRLRLQIESPMDLRNVPVTISIEARGSRIAEATREIANIPAPVEANSPIFQELAKRLKEAEPDRGKHLVLQISLDNFWKQRWRLDWDPIEIEWLNNDGEWFAVSEDKKLDIRCYDADLPLAQVPYDAGQNITNQFKVLLPVSNKVPIYLGAKCEGPHSISPGDLNPEILSEVVRAANGSANATGFEDAVGSYLGWACATPETSIALFASQEITKRIETLLVEQLCGRSWLETEYRCTLTGGSIFDVLTSEAVEGQLAVGPDLPPVPRRLWRLFERSLSENMQQAWPDLTQELPDLDFEKFAIAMDEAIILTYETLAENFEGEEAAAFSDADTYSESDRWEEAFGNARDRISGKVLASMILPTERGNKLQSWDYSLGEARLVEHLCELHIDPNPRGQKHWIGSSNIQDCLHLWIEPPKLLSRDNWEGSLEKFLQDRQTARAVRYAALRFRALRNLTNAHV